MQTIAEMYIEQGRLPSWVSARVRTSDERQLMRRMDRLLGATTLDDVFA